jgi:hypothetical protein
MAATDEPIEPVEPVEPGVGVDDGAEPDRDGGADRSFDPLPAPDTTVEPGAEHDGSALEQSQQSQQ